MPREYKLLLTEEEAAEFIRFLSGETTEDDVLITMIRLQMEEQNGKP